MRWRESKIQERPVRELAATGGPDLSSDDNFEGYPYRTSHSVAVCTRTSN